MAAAAAGIVQDELAVPGPANLGLAGGSTPAETYRELSRAEVDWGSVTLWMGDERWVPPNHPDSNARMARELLGGAAAEQLIAPVFGDDPDSAASAYAAALEAAFASTASRPGTVLLGLGPDGHTASLFPGTAALDARERIFVANYVSGLGMWRLTATLPLLAAATHLLFVVTGRAKAAVVAEILDGAAPYPARTVVEAATGAVTWILDAAAASELRRT